MTSSATLVFANHRPEIIPLAEQLMMAHDTIILEEPADDRFETMLAGGMTTENYLEDQDLEYPAFGRRMAHILRERYRAGVRLVQIDPFIGLLMAIHERFASGEGPDDLPLGTDLHRVYQAERSATAALIDFYQTSTADSFEATIDAVKRFARADAERFALRDSMRAQAIAALLPKTGRAYIEAGPIHFPLWRELKHLLPAGYPLRAHFLMSDVVRKIGFRRHLFGPGDLLTLYFRFHPQGRSHTETLLAARALIYNKLIIKEEIVAEAAAYAEAGSYPHTRDELQVGMVTDRLSLADCRRLYPLVRRASTAVSREIVNRYLGQPHLPPSTEKV